MAKRGTRTEPETGMVKVVDPLYDAPVEAEVHPQEVPAPSGPSMGQRIRRFFDVLIRLVALLIILGIIGLGLYYGLPLLYQKYITPVEQNTAGVTELQSRQEQTDQQLADLQTRLKSLESEQSQTAQSLSKLDKRVSDLESEIAARTKSLEALEKMQSELQSQNETASIELQRQVSLLKAMELLSRARLFMYQSNFGLARQDVQMGRDVLAKVQPDAPKPLSNNLEEVVRRLDLTLFNLPDFPVAASDDLDIAWQMLLSGLPPTQVGLSGTPATSPTLSVTPSAIFTPTLQGTAEPSATP